MKAWVNGYQVSGHPREVAELLSSMKPVPQPQPVKSVPKAPKPLQDTVAQSQQLRQKLEQDPDFNPYPGVVPGENQELPPSTPQLQRLYGAENDTGVKYE